MISVSARCKFVGGSKMPALRTLIVEDYEEFRRFIRSKLQQKTECVIVGECLDGLQAVQQAQELQPDLIFMDVALPKLNGMVALRQIIKVSPNSKIVLLSQNNSAEIVQEALRRGAAGYLLKSDANQLPLAIDAILQGTVYVSSRLNRS